MFSGKQLLSVLDATIIGASESDIASLQFSSLCIDTRMLDSSMLFVALVAMRDGHDFLDDARLLGVKAALVSKAQPNIPLPQIQVPDVQVALNRLSARLSASNNAIKIAITGSMGKTTAKNMVQHLLSKRLSVLATEGNLNNHLGVPIMLSRYVDQAVIVLEMGANKPDEIAPLAKNFKPSIGVITAIENSHIESFGSMETIFETKIGLLEGMQADDCLIVACECRYFEAIQSRAQAKNIRLMAVSFQFSLNADISLIASVYYPNRTELQVQVKSGEKATLSLKALGKPAAYNALFSLACAVQMGWSLTQAALDLSDFEPTSGRLFPYSVRDGDFYLIDDTYNASVESVLAACDFLSQLPYPVLVLGDLAEIGDQKDTAIAAINEAIAEKPLCYLYTFGQETLAIKHPSAQRIHCYDFQSLLDSLMADAPWKHYDKPSILIKGSRGMKLERLVDWLVLHLFKGQNDH